MQIEERLKSVRFKPDLKSHIQLDQTVCKNCVHHNCVRCCPAQCYKESDGEVRYGHEGCLECGLCRFVCDQKAVIWQYPRGGYGITYRFG